MPITHADGDGNGTGDLQLILRDLLREALENRSDPGSEREAVRKQLRILAAHSIQHGEHVEAIVIALKKEWRALPAVHSLRGSEADEALARIVTLCIREYYDVRPES